MTRKTAIIILKELTNYFDDYQTMAIRCAIEALEQEPREGTWGKDGQCPFCGYLAQWEDDHFCAHCGARLEANEEINDEKEIAQEDENNENPC